LKVISIRLGKKSVESVLSDSELLLYFNVLIVAVCIYCLLYFIALCTSRVHCKRYICRKL